MSKKLLSKIEKLEAVIDDLASKFSNECEIRYTGFRLDDPWIVSFIATSRHGADMEIRKYFACRRKAIKWAKSNFITVTLKEKLK